MQPVSVIIIATDDASRTRRCMLNVLGQRYFDFEVLLAIPFHYRADYDWVEDECLRNPMLRCIPLPESSHIPAIDIGKKKKTGATAALFEMMSLGLAVRATRNETIVVTRGDCNPVSQSWLTVMTEGIWHGHDVVAGYANYDIDHTASYAPFMRAVRNLATMQFSVRSHVLYRADACNLAFRKDKFLKSDIFASLVNSPRHALAVWANSQTNACACFSADACVLQHMPSGDRWINEDAASWRCARKRLPNKYRFRFWYCLHALAPLSALFVALALILIVAFNPTNIFYDKLWLKVSALTLIPIIYIVYTQWQISRFNRMLAQLGGAPYTFSAWWYGLALWNKF